MRKSIFERIPHAITMIFSIIVLVTILTYVLPAGAYERIQLNGRSTVVPNSYKTIPSTSINILEMFTAIPLGFKAAVDIIFIVLAGGIMFRFMEKSKCCRKWNWCINQKFRTRSKVFNCNYHDIYLWSFRSGCWI